MYPWLYVSTCLPSYSFCQKPTSAKEIPTARARKSINGRSSGRIYVTLVDAIGRDKRKPASAPSFTEPKRICLMPPKSPHKKPLPVLKPFHRSSRFSTAIDASRDSLKGGGLNSEDSDGNAVTLNGPASPGNKMASPVRIHTAEASIPTLAPNEKVRSSFSRFLVASRKTLKWLLNAPLSLFSLFPSLLFFSGFPRPRSRGGKKHPR